MSDVDPVVSNHRWVDVALLPTSSGGAGWAAGQRYRCSRCCVERRRSGDELIYFTAEGRRVSRAPACQ